MQTVTRTRPNNPRYIYEPDAFSELKKLLDKGYEVVMCNKIGDDLEYILEKTGDSKDENRSQQTNIHPGMHRTGSNAGTDGRGSCGAF